MISDRLPVTDNRSPTTPFLVSCASPVLLVVTRLLCAWRQRSGGGNLLRFGVVGKDTLADHPVFLHWRSQHWLKWGSWGISPSGGRAVRRYCSTRREMRFTGFAAVSGYETSTVQWRTGDTKIVQNHTPCRGIRCVHWRARLWRAGPCSTVVPAVLPVCILLAPHTSWHRQYSPPSGTESPNGVTALVGHPTRKNRGWTRMDADGVGGRETVIRLHLHSSMVRTERSGLLVQVRVACGLGP